MVVEIDSGDHTNTTCTICSKKYNNRRNYRKHVTRIHKGGRREPAVDWFKKQRTNSLVAEMDAGNDKNKRCTVCDWEFDKRGYYVQHVNKVHKDGKKEPVYHRRNVKKEIDPNDWPIWNDPNDHCRACGKSFFSKWAYRKHIKRFHVDFFQEAMQSSK